MRVTVACRACGKVLTRKPSEARRARGGSSCSPLCARRSQGPGPSAADLFDAKVLRIPFVECWLWTGAIYRGYGRFRWKGGSRLAHRVSYEMAVGPIPQGLTLDHLCRNTLCVRPDHLEPVTSGENTRRGFGVTMQHARKTHCIRGHELSGENLKPRPDEPRTRQCRLCMRIRRSARTALAATQRNSLVAGIENDPEHP